MTHDELTAGRRVRFTDLGFGEVLAHPRSGHEATILVPYRPDEGLVITFDDGASTWIHPTEAELLDRQA